MAEMKDRLPLNLIKHPIGLIALFVALTELIAGVGLIMTSGTVQLLLTIFAISFPIFTVIGFIYLILRHSNKLYGPSEYSAQLEGVASYEVGNYSGALKAFDKAIEADPSVSLVWSNKAAVLRDLGRYEESLESLDKAIELNPDLADAWNNKGAVLASLGRFEESLKSLDKAIELNPDLADAWNNKGNMLANLGRYEEALELYEKAIEMSPNVASAFYNIACALSRIGRKAKSIGYLQRAIEMDPSYRELANSDEDFRTLRDDEEFTKLVTNSSVP